MTDMIHLNVTALTRLTYAAVPSMVARGGGAVINIASIVAINPEVRNGGQSLKHELADKNSRIQAVAPGATATEFWETAGVPLEHLPAGIVMRAEDMVDAALAGFDQGELVTIPALPDVADWDAYEAARQKLIPNLSQQTAATRYQGA
ncbi:hypothetical protein G6F57_019687 [Rhizopus arrhizus]|nr:hypothetical protein G6F57_019687 [Rhizopus arrhizus]